MPKSVSTSRVQIVVPVHVSHVAIFGFWDRICSDFEPADATTAQRRQSAPNNKETAEGSAVRSCVGQQWPSLSLI